MPTEITVTTNQQTLIIQFERAEKKNALTSAMYDTMTEALNQLEKSQQLRAALIMGQSDCFTAGNDLEDFLNNKTGLTGEAPVTRFLKALTQISKPLVAAVNGPAIGIGTTLLLHCDLVYAGPTSKFQMPFVNLGLCPEAGSSLLLPQQLGIRKATELLILGQAFNAEDALKMGIINEIVASETLIDYALDKANQLTKLPAEAVQTTKRLMRMSNQATLEQVVNAEIEAFSLLLEGKAAKEAFTAFFEKRKPNFENL